MPYYILGYGILKGFTRSEIALHPRKNNLEVHNGKILACMNERISHLLGEKNLLANQ